MRARRGTSRGATARASNRSTRLRRRLCLPHGWVIIDTCGPGPFITSATLRRPDGTQVDWTSRDQRKHEQVLDTRRGSTWWAPGAIGWWIGVLFGIGSICFAVGAAPGYADAVGLSADGATFFFGSVVFTTAALLQYLEVANTRRTPPGAPARQRWRLIASGPDRIDSWAASVQLAGTVFFNLSTFAALSASTAQQVNRRVWTPDAFGCACFVVASSLAWFEVCHGRWSWPPQGYAWWIAGLNLAGSFAFGISAVASHVVPATDQVRNVALMNLGTFIGALGFLVGGVLLLPELSRSTTSKGSHAMRKG